MIKRYAIMSLALLCTAPAMTMDFIRLGAALDAIQATSQPIIQPQQKLAQLKSPKTKKNTRWVPKHQQNHKNNSMTTVRIRG